MARNDGFGDMDCEKDGSKSSDARVHVVQEKSADVTLNNIVDNIAALVKQAQKYHDNVSELRRSPSQMEAVKYLPKSLGQNHLANPV